jgi:hypothetical protein
MISLDNETRTIIRKKIKALWNDAKHGDCNFLHNLYEAIGGKQARENRAELPCLQFEIRRLLDLGLFVTPGAPQPMACFAAIIESCT